MNLCLKTHKLHMRGGVLNMHGTAACCRSTIAIPVRFQESEIMMKLAKRDEINC